MAGDDRKAEVSQLQQTALAVAVHCKYVVVCDRDSYPTGVGLALGFDHLDRPSIGQIPAQWRVALRDIAGRRPVADWPIAKPSQLLAGHGAWSGRRTLRIEATTFH